MEKKNIFSGVAPAGVNRRNQPHQVVAGEMCRGGKSDFAQDIHIAAQHQGAPGQRHRPQGVVLHVIRKNIRMIEALQRNPPPERSRKIFFMDFPHQQGTRDDDVELPVGLFREHSDLEQLGFDPVGKRQFGVDVLKNIIECFINEERRVNPDAQQRFFQPALKDDRSASLNPRHVIVPYQFGVGFAHGRQAQDILN